jgi:hypothetical protein
MIRKLMTLGVVAAAFTLSACSEVPQGVVGGKKPDEKAYVAADNKFVVSGWKSGDPVTWENQLKVRSQGQDDYTKAK